MSITIKFTSGKEIELTPEEYEELVALQRVKYFPPYTNPWPPYPVPQPPFTPWTSGDPYPFPTITIAVSGTDPNKLI